MLRRSVLVSLLLLAVAVLPAGVRGENEQLVYTGEFVSVNSPLVACSRAVAGTQDGLMRVPGVGVWFQVWDLAGISRTNGPVSTAFANSVGQACSRFNLGEGLHVVQAFGTDGFAGVSSEPAIISNWKTRQAIEGTSAGIASYRLPSGQTCEVPFGLLVQRSSYNTARVLRSTTLRGERIELVSQCGPGGPIEEFLWLDGCNPGGPIRVEVKDFRDSFIAVVHVSVTVRLFAGFGAFACVTTPTGSFRGWLEFVVDTGEANPLVDRNGLVCAPNGTFHLRLIRLNGQVVYNTSGPFRGTTCTFFPPP